MSELTTKRQSLWTRDFILVCLGAFLCNISIQMLNTTLAPFANDMWGSKTLGGFLTSFFNIGSIGMAFFCGALANKLGRRNSLVIGALIFGLPTFLMAAFPTPAVSLTVRVLQGMAKGTLFVAAAAIVVDVTPQERVTEGLGLYGLASTLAMAAGPYIGLAVSDMSYNVMFIICASLFLLGGAICFFINYERKPGYVRPGVKTVSSSQQDGKTYKGVWKLIEKKALLSGVNFSIFFASNSCVLIFIAVYSKEVLGYSSLQTCAFYIAAAAAMLFIRFYGGRLSDKYGPLTMIIPAHIATFIMLALLISPLLKMSYVLYLVCGAMYGIATSAAMPSMNAMAVLYSPISRNGEANATFAFIQDFGILFASLSFGSVIDAGATPEIGYKTMFAICVAIAAISLTISLLIYNKKTRLKNIENREN